MMATDFATILTSLSHPLTKTIAKTAEGLVTRTDQTVRYFKADERQVCDIASLAELLELVSADPQSCIVRGAVAPTANRDRMLRRKLEREDAAPTLIETPRRWLLLDVDGFGLPANFDPFASAPATVRTVVARLPAVFRNVTCWYQFTASAGIKPGLHIRLAFWLDRPLGEADLKEWLAQKVIEPGQGRKTRFKEYPVDPSFFGTVQPNYIAKPIIANGAYDPLAGRCPRSGIMPGLSDVVAVPTIEVRVMAKSPTGQRASDAVIGSTFAECLDAIGDHEGGNGCHNALRHAAAVWWRRKGADGDADMLMEFLQDRVASAEWDPAKHPAEYLRNELARLESLSESIRGQQRATELREGDERLAALCPWPTAGVSLAEAEPVLREHIDRFFDEAVPEADELRAEYAVARGAFEAELEERRAVSAEVEFGAIDADMIFDDEPEAPELPQFAQHGIKVTAGAGKSHATLAKMIESIRDDGRTFAFAVPTHKKAEETAELANRLAGETIAAVWRGIDRDDPSRSGEKMCRRAPAVKEVLRASGSINDLCGSSKRGLCPFHPAAGGGCTYRLQAEAKPKIWVITHASLATPPHPSVADVDALVVDEALGFGNARFDKLPISDFAVERARRSELDAILPRAGASIGQVTPGDFMPRDAFEAAGITTATCAVARRCEQFGFMRVTAAFDPRSDDDAIVARLETVGAANRLVQARLAFWRQLGSMLAGDVGTSGRVRVLPGDSAEIEIATPYRPHARWLDRPVLHLDATMDPLLVLLWLPRFVLQADIRIEKGTGTWTHQVIDQAVSYSRIIPGVGADGNPAKRKAQEGTFQKILRKMEVSAAEDRRAGGITACAAPKGFEELANERWKLWGTRPPNIVIAHHGALRGLNEFEGARRVIVISRPEPGAGDVERISNVEFDHQASPVISTGFYPTRPVALRTDGNSRPVLNETYHPDPSVMAVFRQIRDAEVTQAAHRGRPVRRGDDDPLILEIVAGVAVDITLDSTGTFGEWVETSPAHVLLARGFWPDDWEGKKIVLRDLYDTRNAVRCGFDRDPTATCMRQSMGESSVKGAQTPYRESLIRGLSTFQDALTWPRFKYRLPRSRNSHIVAVDPVLHPDPAAAWTARLGVGALDLFAAVVALPPTGAADRPILRLEAAPSIVADIFGTDRRETDAPPLPAAPMHLRTAAGQVRFWPDGGAGQPIIIRPAAPLRKVLKREPLLTVDDIRSHVGITAFAFNTAMHRSRYRKLAGAERERAAIQWLTLKVGREQFIAAVRELGATMRERA